VTAVEPAQAALALGVDLIITDHHNPPASMDALPRAYAVVHPRRPDSAYPFGDLCGAGVAYKLAWRIATLAAGSARVGEESRALLIELLGLAALGVIADVVPLQGENRVIARYGLSRIKHSRIPGLRALVQASGLDGDNVDADDVGFRLGPRLNACGRLGHAREAVELLTTAQGERAPEIAQALTRLNDQRRATEHAIFEDAAARAQAAGMTGPDRRAIVLADRAWHAGVVGIVCSRLVERFHRPAILLSESEGVLHGSGRSVEGFSLHNALEQCRDHLLTFGGHDMAAGLKLHAAGLPSFVDSFTGVANRAIAPDDLHSVTTYDCNAALEELTPDAVRALAALGPFGRANPEVRLRLPSVRVCTRPEVFGSQSRHASFHVAAAGGPPIRLVGWRWADRIADLARGQTVDVLLTPRLSAWGGRIAVEPHLVDVRIRG
jgi:single-stranded-DNA-specific exonuclease